MEATVRDEPSDRYFSAAAIDFAVTDSADEAVAEMKSVNGLKLASHLSAMDHELAPSAMSWPRVCQMPSSIGWTMLGTISTSTTGRSITAFCRSS